MEAGTVVGLALGPVILYAGAKAIGKVDKWINRRWPGRSWGEASYRRVSDPVQRPGLQSPPQSRRE